MINLLCKVMGCKPNWHNPIITREETGVECSRCHTRYYHNEAMMLHRIERPLSKAKATLLKQPLKVVKPRG